MNRSRLLFHVVTLAALLAAGFAAALAGVVRCNPDPLPGDELWTQLRFVGEALSVTFGRGGRGCFTGDGAGLVAAAGWTPWALAAVAALALLWELAGIRLRQTLLGRLGGHAILAGDERSLRRLALAEGGRRAILYVAPDDAARRSLQRRRPFREVAQLDDRGDAVALLDRLAVKSARLLAAATDSDLDNLALCEAALVADAKADLILRLEQPSVRSLGSEPLRRRALAKGVALTRVSLTQLLVRRGLGLAMPGRYVDDNAPRAHLVVCGSGPGIQEAAFHLARQGYGLEVARPRLTVLRTGFNAFAAGSLDRLAGATDAIELSVSDADSSDLHAFDRAMAGVPLNGGPPTSIHCLGEHAGEARALAERWEQVLLGLGLPVPPIVAYGGRTVPGETGMIRTAGRVDLAEAEAFARIMDQRARIVHERYIEGQRRAKGAAFGSLPAEVEWELLAETYQDDNRNVADHIDYKLAVAGFAARQQEAAGAPLEAADIGRLAAVEHARWTASKAVSGWRHGEKRDNDRLLHPDMKPYAALDEDAQRKDREEVATLPELLALGGDRLVRATVFGAVPEADARIDAQLLADGLRRWTLAHPGAFALVRLPLDGAGPVGLAGALIAAGIAVEIVQDRPVFRAIADGDQDLKNRAAAALRGALRIRIVKEGASARSHIAGSAPTLVDAKGAIHAQALA